MATKRVFISGPITGAGDYYKKFLNAEIRLRGQGYDIINPAEITSSMPKDLPWDAYMDMTLPLLKYCDAIYSLKGWERSPGARIEREYASRLRLELMKEDTGTMEIKFTLDEGAYAPEKAHEADAGFDLRAMHDSKGHLANFDQEDFDTGVHVEIPKGYVGYVQGRSGLNFKYGIICPTGTVDSGFTGSIKVKLYYMWSCDLVPAPEIKAGDKIAQLVIQPLADCTLVQVDNLDDTERGDNGFGSTGR